MNRASHSIPAAVLAAACLAAASCGGGGFKVGDEFEPGETRFFDDGVDMMKEPSKLSGQWAFDHGEELEGRVHFADLVALVEVVSVQTVRDLDGVEAKQIRVEVLETFYGDSPSRALTLHSAAESRGHALVLRHESRLSGTFVLFARFFAGEDGEIDNHFHLSPASSEVLGLVRDEVEVRVEEEEEAAAPKL